MIDLDAYCARVGYDGPREPSTATLRALHFLHPHAIAFENIDSLLGRPVLLDAATLERKLVREGRGGYCYEHNLLFAHALRAFGFAVEELHGRVVYRPDMLLPRTHLLLRVTAEGTQYLCDVGFGGNVLTGPLLFASHEPQQTPHEPFQIVPDGSGSAVQVNIRGAWVKLYWFDLSEQLPVDHEPGNWYVSTHPESLFVRRLMVARPDRDRRYALADGELSVHRRDGASEKHTLRGAGELRDALGDLFRLRLPDLPGLDALLIRIAAKHPVPTAAASA